MIEVIPLLEGEGPTQYEPGRVCTSCPTILSIFNGRTRCAQCAPPIQAASSAEQDDAWRQLVELMEES